MKSFFQRLLRPLLSYAAAGVILAGLYMIWLMNDSPVGRIGQLFIGLYLWIFFSLAAYFTWKHFLVPRLKPYPLRTKVWWLLACLLIGVWLADNIPVVLPGGLLVKALLFLFAGLGIGLLLFGLSVFFVTRFRPPNSPEKRRLRWLAFALPLIAVWLIYLLAFWPGMMSADSLDQWGQVLSGQYSDHHPAFHTFTIWLLTRIAETPAIIALAQILGLALVAGAILAYIESLGVASFWVWTACLLFAVSPVNGAMVNTLWKDIPYSTAGLAFTFLIFRLAQSRGSWIAERSSWLLLGCTAALAALFRHNGLQVVMASFPVLLLAFRRQWKPLAQAFLLSLLVYYGITGPIYQLAQVEKTSTLVDAAASLYAVAAEAEPGSEVDVVFHSMNPLSTSWQCTILTPLYQASKNDGTKGINSLPEKALNLIKYSPSIFAVIYRCNRSLVWIIWDPNGELRNPSHAEFWIDPNPYGITPASLFPSLRESVTEFVSTTAYDPAINWLLWRPAIYLYLFLLVVVIAAMRQKNAWIVLAAVPVLLQSIAFTLISMPPNFRYHYMVYLLALVFWPILFLPSVRSKHSEQTSGKELSQEP